MIAFIVVTLVWSLCGSVGFMFYVMVHEGEYTLVERCSVLLCSGPFIWGVALVVGAIMVLHWSVLKLSGEVK